MKEWPRGSGTHNHTSSRPLFRGGQEAAALTPTPAPGLYLGEAQRHRHSHSHQLQASMKEWPRGSGTHNHTSSKLLFRGGPEAAALTRTPAPGFYLGEAQRQRHSYSHQLHAFIYGRPSGSGTHTHTSSRSLFRGGPEAAALTFKCLYILL